jgi:2-polyprenyl-6-methoxyphenol hydroxylase-like FAD-dependent oxidoreductase
VTDGHRIAGLESAARDRTRRRLRARLVVGADGRGSAVAKLAGLNERTSQNNRFAYFACYRDLPLATGSGTQLWFLDPDVAGALPQDSGLTLLVHFGHKRRLPEWKRDLAGSLERAFEKLPEGPPVHAAERVSPVLGKLEAPNVRRSAARPALALVGDGTGLRPDRRRGLLVGVPISAVARR